MVRKRWRRTGLCLCLSFLSLSGMAALGFAAQPESACSALQGVRLSASQIGLPTRGAEVLQARNIESSQRALGSHVPEHCRLLGVVRAVDERAPDIRFEIAMPVGWNRKALMFGGGGFNGTIRTDCD